MSQGWELHADQWLAWARTPNHDAYWDYRHAFFELLPPPGRAALDVGCGEGRATRDLSARGYAVTGLDASPTLLQAAAELDPDTHYVVGQAEALPFDDGAFDLVVAYNVLMDVKDMPQAVAEAGRVLEPGGRLCVCVTHPIAEAGRWQSAAEDSPFIIAGSYLTPERFRSSMQRAGLTMTFNGSRYPLESYARALESAGLLVEAIREPAAPPGARRHAQWARLPMFLLIRASSPRRKRTPSAGPGTTAPTWQARPGQGECPPGGART